MYYAVIDGDTGIVLNVVVPPDDGNEWVPPNGFFIIETSIGKIGQTYTNGEFVD